MSQRVLDLTETIIRMNPAHYSAWYAIILYSIMVDSADWDGDAFIRQYRYQTLLAINAPLDVELKLMDELAVKFLKTYQVWHHRRLLLQHGVLGDSPAIELVFIAEGLSKDEKNYHTWAYRQWVLAHFNRDELWAGELPFVEEMLEIDVRNNSAWNHRFFVVFTSGVRQGDEGRDKVARRELAFTKEKIALAPNNMSAWNYLRGVLEYSGVPFSELEDFILPFAGVTSSKGAEDSVTDLENPPPSQGADLPCPAAIEFLADIYESSGGNDIPKAVSVCAIRYNLVLISCLLVSYGNPSRTPTIQHERSTFLQTLLS